MAQMYKVFINNRPIIFTNNTEEFTEAEKLYINELNPSQLLQKLKDLSQISTSEPILIDLKDIGFPHREFTFLFKEKIAAGGLVINEDREILMIKRNGKWDLPKGHQDGGESIEECAVREVEEETGVCNLNLKEALTITYHHYLLNEKDVLKETHWFLMETTAKQMLKPQHDEGIERVEWASLKKARKRLHKSWLSLLEVLDALEQH